MAWKEKYAEYWVKELQESMDWCTGCRDITEILFKMVLNTIQSYNQQLFKNTETRATISFKMINEKICTITQMIDIRFERKETQ